MRHFKIAAVPALIALLAWFAQALAQSDLEEPDFTGTAFFVSDNGLAVTNFHVIEGSRRILLFDSHAGWIKQARIIAADKANDLALLKTDVQSRPLPLADRFVFRRGEDVLTLGYPSPELQGVNQKATFGRINASTGLSDDIRFVQVDVPVQPGNSGGPLLNGKGEVVGIINARLVGDYQNVSYAVKADYLRPLLTEASVTLASPSLASPSSLAEVVERSEHSVVMVLGYESPGRISPPGDAVQKSKIALDEPKEKDFFPSFDCAKASRPDERAICADPVLAELDVVMAARYRLALDAASNKEALRSRQRLWLKQRGQCADAPDIFTCLQRHYKERLSQLHENLGSRKP